jgi:hypothetical protein|tara:strand:+ start:206 stop:535 length:330 start_codon:yes stop_codon:yes gene_type:complete
MANRYKNANFDLTTDTVTDVYTVPSDSRAIIQNIHVANVGAGNTEIKAFIYDNSASRAYQFAEHTVNAGNSKSVSDGTIILEENDKLQVQAASANIFEGTVSILEFDRT